jgi:outer membrane receptor protein involved in Fe transport
MCRSPAFLIGFLTASTVGVALAASRAAEPPGQQAQGLQQVLQTTPMPQPPVGQPAPSITQPAPSVTQPAPTPTQPAPTTPTATTTPSLAAVPSGLLGSASSSATAAAAAQASPAAQATVASTPATSFAQGGATTLVLGSTDAGDFLNRSSSVQGVETQKRQPIANETRVRGEHLGEVQTWTDGEFWFPARQDLDTFLSKIDSGLIKDAIVIKGPYSVMYGPGLSFIDIETEPTMRSTDGTQWHGRFMSLYRTNGEQYYGRAGAWGGGEDWGMRISYGQRIGNNYMIGADSAAQDVPGTADINHMESRYNARDVDFAFGYDVSPHDHLEFGYLRLDQTGLEFPGQVFDTAFLVTNGYRLRYTSEDKDLYDRFVVDGWYNRTSMAGNAQTTDKRIQIPLLNVINFVGFTDIDEASTGYRAAMTWGTGKCPQLTVGTDLRYLDGQLNEYDNVLMTPCNGGAQNFPIPRNHEVTVGVFAQYLAPVNDCWTLKFGARGDYVGADIDSVPPGFDCSSFDAVAQQVLGTTEFERNMGLWAAFGTSEYKLNQYWTTNLGIGHSEAPPTQTELYAMQPFLAILQQGLTTVEGNPGLAPEKLNQIDLGLRADYGWFRTGVHGFYAFIEDYITYEVEGPSKALGNVNLNIPGANAFTVKFVNTEYATLSGFEYYGEVDVTDWMTPFVTMALVDGRDYTRDSRGAVVRGANGQPLPGIGALGSSEEPLPGMPPFQTIVGVRFHEAVQNPHYGLEVDTVMTAHQHQVAESLGEVGSAGWTIVNLRGYYQVTKKLLITGGVDNLFDRLYREHLDLRTGAGIPGNVNGSTVVGLGVFQPGISPYIGIEYKW